MAFGLHIVEHMTDRPVGTNDKGGSSNPLHFPAIHIFFFDYAKGVAHLFVGVGKKLVRKVILGLKFLLSFRVVGGNAEHYSARFLKIFV